MAGSSQLLQSWRMYDIRAKTPAHACLNWVRAAAEASAAEEVTPVSQGAPDRWRNVAWGRKPARFAFRASFGHHGTMRLYCGTSGYSYKEWRGGFYPGDLAAADMLRYYAERLNTVEINNTFYRMPKAHVVANWAQAVPGDFSFVIKASQRITHRARLRETAQAVEYLWSVLQHLGACRGPLLFQLPPNFSKDVECLESFLTELPGEARAVFEFGHASWLDDDVFSVLRQAGAALCLTDTDERPAELRSTTDWGYLRLRRASYSAAEIKRWSERLREQAWAEAYVFFKHEDDASGPQNATRLRELFA